MQARQHDKSPRIVVGVDGSASADQALRSVVQQAELSGGTVEALIAWQYPVSVTGLGLAPIVMYDDLSFAERAEKILAESINRAVDPASDVPVHPRAVFGNPAQVLLDAWRRVSAEATLVLIGDGPLATRTAGAPKTRVIGPLPRAELPAAYAASELAVLASIPTARFREPWGLVCNEAMHQGRPVIASDSVGAVAGGLVRDGESGLVVASGDAAALAGAIERLLADDGLRARLGEGARAAVAPYTYEAMVAAFERALATALENH